MHLSIGQILIHPRLTDFIYPFVENVMLVINYFLFVSITLPIGIWAYVTVFTRHSSNVFYFRLHSNPSRKKLLSSEKNSAKSTCS